MAKSDTPPFRMIVERGPRLAPATASDAERLDTWRIGSHVNVQFVRNGSRVMERKWWAVLGLVVDQCNVPWKTKEQASEAVKLALGIVNLTKTIGGSWMQYPKSLTELDDAELDAAVRDMMDLVTKLTGIDPETLRKESADVGKDQSEQPEVPSPLAHTSGSGSSGDQDPDASRSAAADQSAGAADQEGGSDTKADEPSSNPALSEADQKKWLVTLAAVVAAVMKECSEADVVTTAANHNRDGLSEPIRKKARSITNYARKVARKEIEFTVGLDLIAGVAGCETREIKP